MPKTPINDKEKAIKFLEVFTLTFIKELCSMHINWMRPKDFEDAMKTAKEYWFNLASYKFFDPNLRTLQAQFISVFEKSYRARLQLNEYKRDVNDTGRLFGDLGVSKNERQFFQDLIPDVDALLRKYYQRFKDESDKYKLLTKELRLSFNALRDSCTKYIEQESKTISMADSDSLVNLDTPFCLIENNFGYLKFGKYGRKIKISRPDSQPFRLLQSLTEPFGAAKRIDAVFEAMREGVRNKGTGDAYFDKDRKFKAILHSGIKELQKNIEFREKLKFEFDNLKSKVWLKLLD